MEAIRTAVVIATVLAGAIAAVVALGGLFVAPGPREVWIKRGRLHHVQDRGQDRDPIRQG